MNISWVSESVPPMGAIKGEGVTKQLGRPTLDPLTVLVREAAQNSWDAAAPSRDRPVHFQIDLCKLAGGPSSAWQSLHEGAPAAQHLPLVETLERPDLSVLFVSDRGTTGLGGPTRANEVTEGMPHDYVSFFLNVGDPRDTEYGGGTYGYGKAVFFRRSEASTIVAYTRCTNAEGEVESRLLGCALGRGFALAGCAYTGRHWLGLAAGGGIVDPVVEDAADALAASLGFPPFEDGPRGARGAPPKTALLPVFLLRWPRAATDAAVPEQAAGRAGRPSSRTRISRPPRRTRDDSPWDTVARATGTGGTVPPDGAYFGAPYRRAEARGLPDEREPFSVDPAIVERGLTGHVDTQNVIADALAAAGITPRSRRGRTELRPRLGARRRHLRR
jgi:hypothetical protein